MIDHCAEGRHLHLLNNRKPLIIVNFIIRCYLLLCCLRDSKSVIVAI